MRNTTFVLVTVLVAGAGIALGWWALREAQVGAPPATADAPTDAANGTASVPPEPAAAPAPAPAVAAAPAAATRAVETPAAPTGIVCIVDDDGQPLPGASVHRLPDGERIAAAGADGCCALAVGVPAALFADDRLLRLVTPLPAAAERPLRVVLPRDRWSPRAVVECSDDAGAPVAGARALCRLRGSGAPPPGLALASSEALAAWGEHATLANVPELAARGRLVVGGSERALRLDARTELRCLAAGAWSLLAVAEDGRMAAVDFAVESAAPVTVRAVFHAPQRTAGLVVADGGAPIGGALVDVADLAALLSPVTTDANGRFAFGALPGAPLLLRVRAQGCAEVAHGPVEPGAGDLRIALSPSGGAPLRGRVIAAAGDAPVAGATVDGSEDGAAPVRASTAADGAFELATAGRGEVMLRVTAPTFAPFARKLPADADRRAAVTIALWPDTAAARVAAALTGTLEGRVVDAQGRAVADALVRWQGAESAPAARADRFESPPALPQLVHSDRDGRFAIEIAGSSRGTLYLVTPVLRIEQGIQATSVPGIRRTELQLRTAP